MLLTYYRCKLGTNTTTSTFEIRLSLPRIAPVSMAFTSPGDGYRRQDMTVPHKHGGFSQDYRVGQHVPQDFTRPTLFPPRVVHPLSNCAWQCWIGMTTPHILLSLHQHKGWPTIGTHKKCSTQENLYPFLHPSTLKI